MPPRRGVDRRVLELWQVARVRKAYTSVSGKRSPLSGRRGMLEEMRWGLAGLDDVDRRSADEGVLEAIFGSPAAARLLRWLWRAQPRRVAGWMAKGAPLALGWLVGPVEASAMGNVVPECAFRREGGADLCERVCRRPTESFCARRAVPVTLQPDPESLACRWTWRAAS
jgi:hypothetical protein